MILSQFVPFLYTQFVSSSPSTLNTTVELLIEPDGIEVCQTLKSDIKTSHIPIILLSARSNDESKIEGLKSGADVYLTKPFSLEVLKTQLASLLDNRKKLHKEFKKLNFEPSTINISSLDELFVENMIDIIKDNIDNSTFTVQELSNLCGMSRTTFFNKVKSITGLKPTEFLRNYRLNWLVWVVIRRRCTIILKKIYCAAL